MSDLMIPPLHRLIGTDDASDCSTPTRADLPPLTNRTPRARTRRSTYPRKRAVTACLTCRERKKKCDNNRPSCGFCQQAASPCVYLGNGPSTYDQASLDILDRLSTIEALLRNGATARRLDTINGTTIGHFPSIQVNVEQVTAAKTSPRPVYPYLPSLSWIRTDTVLSWPVFQEAELPLKEWVYLDQNGTHGGSVLEVVDSYHHSSLKLAVSPRPLEIPALPSLSLERELVEPLVDQYFRGVNTKNPILERSTIRHLCQDLYENGLGWDCSTCLILIICALGVMTPGWTYENSSVQPGEQYSNLANHNSNILQIAQTYFEAAEKRLGIALTKCDTQSIQCLCLAGVYHMYRLSPKTALRMFHAAGNALQTLFVTIRKMDPAVSGLLSGKLDLLQRLVWTCAKSEREILGEFPLGPPALTHVQLFEHYPPPPRPEPTDDTQKQWQKIQEESWYYYLAEIALRRIADDVVRTVFEPEQKHDFCDSHYPISQLLPTVIEFERQLDVWHRSLPSSIAFSPMPEPLPSELQYFSRSRYYLVSGLLYRPFICYVVHNPACADSEVRTMASKGISYAFNYLIASNHGHRHHGKWLQLRRELTASCLLLAASGAGLAMPENWHYGVERAQASFRYWSRESSALKSYIELVAAVDNHFCGDQTPE
ncbi:hypothetical protein F5884DRAFT_131737 [Xylogone sp. PMI_703]|nr:hypothetical protein F5884DRAFT_131737 [Xylogone sp. PMI_703]